MSIPIESRSVLTGRGLVACLVALLFVPFFGQVADAQQADASIIGQITDANGGALPGVTVTATSPALILGKVTAVSDQQGQYRLTPLPIGTYAVEYSLQGFQTIIQPGVILTAGFVARLNQGLKVAATTQTVTVDAAPPVVDTTSTTTNIILTQERLQTVPTSGFGYVALVNQAPGVRGNLDIGGTVLEAGGGGFLSATVFGQSETWQLVEGVTTNSGKQNSQSGSFLDYYSVGETNVETAGANAESRTPGVTIQTIIKSGSNTFHGSGLYTLGGSWIESSNLTPTLIADGVTSANTVVSRSNWAADIGGPIKKDKLWFYQDVSFRSDIFEFLSVALPNGAPATNDKRETFFTSKVSYQLNPKNKLIFFNETGYSSGLVTFLSAFFGWDTRVNQTFWDNFAKAEWQYIPRNNLVTSLQFGFADWNSYKFCPSNSLPSTMDIVTKIEHGCDFSRDTNLAYEPTLHGRGVMTWILPHSRMGTHQFDIGFDYLDMRVEGKYSSRGPQVDYQLVFNNGVPYELNTDNFPQSGESKVEYTGIYVQDKWSIGRRLTLNWGFRYSHDDGTVPAQCTKNGNFTTAACYQTIQFPIWNTVAPRVEAVWDITGSGKTVLRGGWGRFDHPRENDPEVDAANVNTATETTYLWHDLNGDKLYEPGEVNLNVNGSDFVSTSPLGTAGGTSFLLQNPNEKEPKQNQYQISVERQIMPNTTIRVLGMYALLYNNYMLEGVQRPYSAYNIPVTKTIPLANGSAGTQSITFYEYASNLTGEANSNTELINNPMLNKWYKSIEIDGSRRLTRKLFFQGSYATTRYHEPIQTNGLPADTPNAFIGTGNYTWDWLGRVEASYVFPYKLTLSTNFENRSGTIFARNALFTDSGAPIPSITLNVEPLGSERDPSTNLLDFRLSKAFALRGDREIAVRMNVYNTLNINTVLSANATSGSKYLLPTTIAPPRIFEFGTSFKF